jgi:hypothetical protein
MCGRMKEVYEGKWWKWRRRRIKQQKQDDEVAGAGKISSSPPSFRFHQGREGNLSGNLMWDFLPSACGGRPPVAGASRSGSGHLVDAQCNTEVVRTCQGRLRSSQEKARPHVCSPETTDLVAHQFRTSSNTVKTHHITRLCHLHTSKCASSCACLKDYLFIAFLLNLILTICIKFGLIN